MLGLIVAVVNRMLSGEWAWLMAIPGFAFVGMLTLFVDEGPVLHLSSTSAKSSRSCGKRLEYFE